METIIHKADTRGKANHGWLDTHHTFSFGSYYDPARTNFGALRVLNDDVVSGGAGFGNHPHDNMEIVSIPLAGSLEHKDSMGNIQVIKTNEVQIMSAGNGVMHSEYNHSKTESVNFLQIWVFPKERDIKPRYQQKYFDPESRHNSIQTVVSPNGEGDALQINQDAFFALGNYDTGMSGSYNLHNQKNGLYIFLIEGEISIQGERISKRDGIGIWDTDEVTFEAAENSQLLFIEVPMVSR